MLKGFLSLTHIHTLALHFQDGMAWHLHGAGVPVLGLSFLSWRLCMHRLRRSRYHFS